MKQTLKFSHLLILVLLVAHQSSQAQYAEEPTPTLLSSDPTRYTTHTFGLNLPTYRDFATSPLFYNGGGIMFALDLLKVSELREQNFSTGVTINLLNSKAPSNQLLNPSTSSTLIQISASYERLWKLNPLSGGKYNTKIGAIASYTQNFRITNALMNNALGLESFLNIGFSGQAIRDVSRTKEKTLNLIFLKKKLKPIKRDLQLGLSTGLLNLNNRPGYAYIYEKEYDPTESASKTATEGYIWSMNGWNLGTEVEWIMYRPDGSAHSWSYNWNATSAPGKYEDFQMAAHQITYTRYVNKNKKEK